MEETIDVVVPVVLGLLSLVMALFGFGAKRIVGKVDDHETRVQELEQREAAAVESRKAVRDNLKRMETGQMELHVDVREMLKEMAKNG